MFLYMSMYTQWSVWLQFSCNIFLMNFSRCESALCEDVVTVSGACFLLFPFSISAVSMFRTSQSKSLKSDVESHLDSIKRQYRL